MNSWAAIGSVVVAASHSPSLTEMFTLYYNPPLKVKLNIDTLQLLTVRSEKNWLKNWKCEMKPPLTGKLRLCELPSTHASDRSTRQNLGKHPQ
jgi:hypothetical protein